MRISTVFHNPAVNVSAWVSCGDGPGSSVHFALERLDRPDDTIHVFFIQFRIEWQRENILRVSYCGRETRVPWPPDTDKREVVAAGRGS